MALEFLLDEFPKEVRLENESACSLRPLEEKDEEALLKFFADIPQTELLFIKHRVTERSVIHDWCANIDLERNFPLLGCLNEQVLGVCTLHQQLGGWKRHIGRVSVHVHPKSRGLGLARNLVTEIIEVARQSGLERIEAEFVGEQQAGMKMFSHLGFTQLFRLEDYVKDMQAISHDYVVMGLDLITDEEYAGMG
jgi:N-acetylglutamate synthase-like GNAT family acetyltransferase